MNQQQILDEVCTHLAQQKRSTWSIDGQCVYFSPVDDLKCNIGCLMSKEQLVKYGDYKGYVRMLEQHARQAGDSTMSDFLRDNHDLLEQLQKDHDGDACDVVEMRNRLTSTARAFGLNTGAVAQIKEWNG